MKTDYPELEGKKIRWISVDGHVYAAVVVGVCYSVGITIVDAYDFERKLTCLNYKGRDRYPFRYRDAFHLIVKQIRTGEYCVAVVQSLYKSRYDRGFPMSPCAFGA